MENEDFNIFEREEYQERRRLRKELKENSIKLLDDFLTNNPPKVIERELNKYIVGQPELTKQVADFIYYQVMRSKHHELPSRPLLICGPSSSGKTEVWRIAQKLYGNILNISIADGTKFSSEGWSGNYKLSCFLTKGMDNGILVIDEFDKMAIPRYSSTGSNVSADLQAEFLKVLEDNYVIKDNKHPDTELIVEQLGVVFIGAFEVIREQKEKPSSAKIGFGTCKVQEQISERINENDLYEYGIINELLGRLCGICNTNPLTEEQCLQIVKSKNSRTGVITKILAEYGIDPWNNLTDSDIIDLIRESEINKTGIRSVLAKVETILLESIRTNGLVQTHELDPEIV